MENFALKNITWVIIYNITNEKKSLNGIIGSIEMTKEITSHLEDRAIEMIWFEAQNFKKTKELQETVRIYNRNSNIHITKGPE